MRTELEKNSTEFFKEGLACYHSGDYAKAIEYYDKALKLEASIVEALINKGMCLDKLKRPAEALECYEQALVCDPKNSIIYYNRGVSLEALDQVEIALASYKQALKYNPKDVCTHLNISALYGRMGRYAAVIHHCSIILGHDPNNTQAKANQGRAEALLKAAQRRSSVPTLFRRSPCPPESAENSASSSRRPSIASRA